MVGDGEGEKDKPQEQLPHDLGLELEVAWEMWAEPDGGPIHRVPEGPWWEQSSKCAGLQVPGQLKVSTRKIRSALDSSQPNAVHLGGKDVLLPPDLPQEQLKTLHNGLCSHFQKSKTEIAPSTSNLNTENNKKSSGDWIFNYQHAIIKKRDFFFLIYAYTVLCMVKKNKKHFIFCLCLLVL